MSNEYDTEARIRDMLVERCARTGETEGAAMAALRQLWEFHAVSGTLPEALWRYGFCRPADGVTMALACNVVFSRH